MVSSSPLRMRTLAWRARWRLGKTTWLALETHECETKEKVGKTACNGRRTCDFSHFTSAGFSKIFHSLYYSWVAKCIDPATNPTRLADAAAEGERVGPVNADGAVDLLVREGGAAVLSERNNSQSQPYSESFPPPPPT